MMTVPVPKEAQLWIKAAGFPADKENYYPEHGGVQEFDQHRGERALEYGCGGGSDAMSFLRRGNETWFADIVPGNIAASQARIDAAGLGMKAHPVLLECSAPLPFLDGSFDVASSHGVLHHIPVGVEEVVREFHRVLRPGGAVYIMLYTEGLWELFRPDTERRLAEGTSPDKYHAFCQGTDPGMPYARFYTESEGRALLEQAGFQVEYAKTWNTSYFRTYKGRR